MKTRSLLLLISILIIGFILGWLSSTSMSNRRLKEFRSYASYEGFRYHALDVLNPTEEQKEEIIPVIEEFSEKNQELKLRYRKEFGQMMKKYREELTPLLTDEQLRCIEKGKRRNSPSNMRRRGPGRGERHRDGSGPPPSR
ncbi:MAG: hypothetical protein U9N53_09445 [Bacteroidota bacterium]|nr:hypothetical protein [Bacteroidota bacterium]